MVSNRKFGLIYSELFQNLTIEERVAILETQVVEIEEDVNFLFDESVIRDERLLTLEEETNILNQEVEGRKAFFTVNHLFFVAQSFKRNIGKSKMNYEAVFGHKIGQIIY